MPFFAYILENAEGRFYVGHTDDLDQRLSEHNAAEKVGTKFTHKNGPWRLIWHEQYPSRSEAMKRERQIKSMKSARWIREHVLSR